MRSLLPIFLSLFLTGVCWAGGDDAFAAKVNLDPLNTLIVQHNQTLKTLDSFSRQELMTITGGRSLDGRPSTYTMLDMTFRPQMYNDRNVIRVKNVPLRKDFQLLDSIGDEEKDRILNQGTISLKFWFDPRVQQLMSTQQQTAVFKAKAINQVQESAATMMALAQPDMFEYRFFAPRGGPGDSTWHSLPELLGTVPAWVDLLKAQQSTPPPALAGYENRVPVLNIAGLGLMKLRESWIEQDADSANGAIANIVANLPKVNPEVYPSEFKRKAENLYNKFAQMTIPAIMLYFAAFVLFLASARSGLASLRLWGLRMMILAFLVHTVGIAMRWWLVEKSVGNWFESIPIKNEFESVMFSAWFGALVALVLEFRKPKSVFGAAGSFVGTLAMVALFTAPFFVQNMGSEIEQVNGVLMSYWLYIHVTMVTASYSLIGMGFLLSTLWLWTYYRRYGTLSRLPNKAALSADANREFDVIVPNGGAATMTLARTMTDMFFLTRPMPQASTVSARSTEVTQTQSFLATLDACNLVVLQLAFWVLGVGIILGAVWADQSWGRPWGWDPKETFALVTWIIYLIVVHVRVATTEKAWWTAVLSWIGFFVMLFNWVGVNYFLVGLHSYA